MPTKTKPHRYTPAEYLDLEAQSESKHEYRDGNIVPVAGGSINHNEIAGNLYAHLKFGLRRQNYRVYMSDVRLWIPSNPHYVYPDVMVIAGEPAFEGNRSDTVTNPILIAEVLSDSTRNYDRGDKFRLYRSIPQLREYILIEQDSMQLEQYSKVRDRQWLLTEYHTEDAVLILSAIEFQISLQDIYDRVQFLSETKNETKN